AEAHGREIGAYMDDLPRAVRFLQDNAREPEEILGSQLSGSDEERTYDGVVEMHRHFLERARKNQPATSSFDDALETMRLCARIEQGARQQLQVGLDVVPVEGARPEVAAAGPALAVLRGEPVPERPVAAGLGRALVDQHFDDVDLAVGRQQLLDRGPDRLDRLVAVQPV